MLYEVITTTLDLTKFKDLLITALVIMLPMAIILLQNDTGSALCYLGFVFVFYREGMSPYFLIAAILMVIFFVISMILGQNAVIRITSYNVCYTKLLRRRLTP